MSAILPLRLEGLGYAAAGLPLLEGVDLTIPAARHLVILGPNGAGKSLLLRLAHGLLEPTAGRVIWADGSARPARQAMLLQHPVLLRRSVRANLAFPLPRAGRAARVEAALAAYGLTDLADRPARQLSGGERQRLALARAAITNPQILFLDEPTAAMDPGSAARIEAMMRDFSAAGITLVTVTHDLALARRIADDAAFLHRGRLLQTGPAATLFDDPQSPALSAFLAGEPYW